MRKWWALGVAVVMAIGMGAPVNAAPMDKTLKACGNSKGCGFSKLDNGDVVGCSPKSKGGNGRCFYCNSSTKDCFQVRRIPGGKWKRLPGDVLSNLPKRTPISH